MLAVSTSMSCSAIFQSGAIGISGIASVFVGQYNGVKDYRKIGEPVWQMIYFSIASSLVYIPAGILLGPIIIPEVYRGDGIPYFQVIKSLDDIRILLPALLVLGIIRVRREMK